MVAGRRLLPAAVPIWFLYDAGRAIIALITLAIFGGGLSPILGIIVGFMFIGPVVRYMRFRYDLQGDTLVVQGGLFNRWRRVIPRERVQSVDVVQKLRHRAFGVVEIRVEAIGGKQTEATLVAVDPAEAKRIRVWASAAGAGSPDTEPSKASPALARLTTKDLFLAGLTGGRVAVLAVLIGYAQELIGEDSLELVAGWAGQLLPETNLVGVIVALVLAVLTISVVLSIALTVIIYWDFTVRLDGDRLVITRGLLDKRRAQIPLRRIQAIQVEENFIRRPFGLASLTVVVAGYASEGQDSQESSMLLPLGRREKAWQVAESILGAANLEAARLERPPRRSAIRRAVLPTVLGTAGAATAFTLLGPPWEISFTIVPASWILAWLFWRCSAHQIVPGFVLIRAGAMVRRTSILPEPNIQHLQLSWSGVQRAFRLATVAVYIPGTQRRAGDLEREEARRWFKRLSEGPSLMNPDSRSTHASCPEHPAEECPEP